MLHLRAVFSDGSVSFAYSAETEEEIRFKIKLGYFERPKQVYVLVGANDAAAVSQAKEQMSAWRAEQRKLAYKALKAKRQAKKIAIPA